MSHLGKQVGLACLLASAAFVATPALADGSDFSGILGGDYAHLSSDHGFGDANQWGVTGSGAFNLGDSGLALEGDAGWQDFSGHGSVNVWNADGSLFWRMSQGRIGGVVGYADATNGGGHLINYGGFGEWFAGQSFTVGLKGGGFSASGSTNGYYGGAALTGYVTPDFGVTGSLTYSHFDHFTNDTDWGVKAEYLISENTPISIYGSYTNSNLSSGGPTINSFLVGFNFYLNGPSGGSTLVDRTRDGPAQWGTSFNSVALTF